MLEREREGGVAVSGVIVEDTAVDLCSGCAGDLDCRIRRMRVEDVDIVGPCDGGKRGRQIALLILCEDEDGDWGRGHLGYGIA